MGSRSMQQTTREVVKKKFGGKRLLVSESVPNYPRSLEREYVRVTNAYMKLLADIVAEHTPRIREALNGRGRYAQDAADDEPKPGYTAAAAAILPSIDKIFDEIIDGFAKRQGLFGLSAKIEKLSNLSRKLTIAEWKRVVKRTLGINIAEDYYRGAKFQRLFDKWIADNVGLIKTIPHETLGSMRDIVKSGYLSGASNKTIAKQIQGAYGTNKYRAQFIARDQAAKLNAQITREQQADAGVTEYIWRTTGDQRVRDSHAKLNGKRFKYADPPIVDKRTGRRENPGGDYQCRCVALPIFDIDGVTLPWEAEPKRSLNNGK